MNSSEHYARAREAAGTSITEGSSCSGFTRRTVLSRVHCSATAVSTSAGQSQGGADGQENTEGGQVMHVHNLCSDLRRVNLIEECPGWSAHTAGVLSHR
jgi:hypothetical protein